MAANPFPLIPVKLADFPRTGWRWPNFSPEEVACKDGTILIHPPSLDKLQRLRSRLGSPMIVNSAYRSPAYNDRVGGAAGSMHLAARAFDIAMPGHDPHEFERLARICGFTGFGFYPGARGNFLHIDTGPAREWGTRWPAYEDEAPHLVTGAEADAKLQEVAAQIGVFVGGPKVANPLKRKQRAA